MLFVLQRDKYIDYLNIDSMIAQTVINESRGFHSFINMDYKELFIGHNPMKGILKNKDSFSTQIQKAIPIGTLEFTGAFMKIFHGINDPIPIEVPLVLRNENFLKRKYEFYDYEDLPNNGYVFLKDVTVPKFMSYCGEISTLRNKRKLSRNHKYLVSEVIPNILSEYRTYVVRGEILGICFYKGNPLVYCDTELIKEAVDIYSNQEDAPKSYTLDVMVSDRGTSIIEIHNFMAVGLYSCWWDNRLLDAYIDGFNYLLKHHV